MRKKIFTLFLLQFFIFIYSQNKDIISLSEGSFVNFDAIYNNESKLEGYITLFDLGKINDTIKKFEYVFLDKNLNNVANQTFLCENNVENYNPYMNYKGKIVLDAIANLDVDIKLILKVNSISVKLKYC